jgi:hypothetical protein
MVRRGSTVRVRQRALQKPRKSLLFCRVRLQDLQYAVCVGAIYGAFRSTDRRGQRRIRPGSGAEAAEDVGPASREPRRQGENRKVRLGAVASGKISRAASRPAEPDLITVPEVSVGRRTLGIRSDEFSTRERSTLS